MGCMYVITSHKTEMLLLKRELPSLAGFAKASFHVVGCHMEKARWPGSEGYLQPTVSKKGKPSIQQLARTWILPATEWISRFISSGGSDETLATENSLIGTLGDPKLRTQVSHLWTSNPCEMTIMCCFKQLSLWQFCYATIYNWCTLGNC